jgi:hypothetical protein
LLRRLASLLTPVVLVGLPATLPAAPASAAPSVAPAPAPPVPGPWVRTGDFFNQAGSYVDAVGEGLWAFGATASRTGISEYRLGGGSWSVNTVSTGPSFEPGSVPSVAVTNGRGAIAVLDSVGSTWIDADISSYGSYNPLGGYMISTPLLVDHDAAGLFVFGAGGDGALWYQRYLNSAWSGWLSLGGRLSSDLGAVSTSQGLFVFGRGADYAVWYQRLTDSGWSGWLSLGGLASSVANATALGDTPHVFAAGFDGAMWENTLNISGWSGWSSQGGLLASPPDVVNDGTTIYAFANGIDGAVWAKKGNSDDLWSPWTTLGGQAISWPAAAAHAQGVNVLVVAPDFRVWVNSIS